MSNTKQNISVLVPSDISSNLSQSTLPNTFGDQIKEVGKNVIVSASISFLNKLKNDLESSILEEKRLDVEHNRILRDLEKQTKTQKSIVNGVIITTPPTLTQEEYEQKVKEENDRYTKEKERISNEKKSLKERIQSIVQDPYDKIKEQKKQLLDKVKKDKSENTESSRQARREQRKKVIGNTAKNLIPSISLIITGKLIDVYSNISEIEDLVNRTNELIQNISSPGDVIKAKTTRDSTLNIINIQERRLVNLSNQISKIQVYITIFSTIVSILSSISIPTSVPPGIGLPLSLIFRITNTIQRANDIVLGLNVVLISSTVNLQRAILQLNELKLRLLNISQSLEGNINSNTLQSPDLSNLLLGNSAGVSFPPYKGFKFAIKPEPSPNPRFVVEGNKRNYAVAIDRDGVERIKSELSFTLDPQILVDQLKLIIDQRNLQG